MLEVTCVLAVKKRLWFASTRSTFQLSFLLPVGFMVGLELTRKQERKRSKLRLPQKLLTENNNSISLEPNLRSLLFLLLPFPSGKERRKEGRDTGWIKHKIWSKNFKNYKSCFLSPARSYQRLQTISSSISFLFRRNPEKGRKRRNLCIAGSLVFLSSSSFPKERKGKSQRVKTWILLDSPTGHFLPLPKGKGERNVATGVWGQRNWRLLRKCWWTKETPRLLTFVIFISYFLS